MASAGSVRVAGAAGPPRRLGRCPAADVYRLGRTSRSPVPGSSWSRNSTTQRGLLQATSHRSPWDTLGVERDASVPEVKRAYRRLVLRYHPDVSPDSEPEEKFLELHDAYMTMIGKTQSGRDPSAPPRDSSSWEFHDWYWSFSTNQRRRRSSTAGYSKRPEAEKAASRSQVQQQLSHLKARARSRRSRSPASPRSPTAAAATTEATAGAAAGGSIYDPEEDDPWADPSLSVDEDTGEEVHPAWSASVGGSIAEGGDAGGAAAAEGAQGASGPSSQQQQEQGKEEEQPHTPHVYAHRPPAMSSSHLGSQLSGLKRRAGLKNRTTAAMTASR